MRSKQIRKKMSIMITMCLVVQLFVGQFTVFARGNKTEISVDVLGESEEVTTPSGIQLQETTITTLAAIGFEWTQSEDGKWRRLVEMPGFDFEKMELGKFDMPSKLPATTKNEIYNDGPGIRGAEDFEIIEGYEGASASRGLMYHNKAKQLAINLRYDMELPVEGNKFELRFKLHRETTEGWLAIHPQQGNGNPIPGMSQYLVGSEIGVHEDTILFDRPTTGVFGLKIGIAPVASKIYFDYFQLVEVSDISPYEVDPETIPPILAKEHDIITPKNSGDFENWGVNLIPNNDESVEGFSKIGQVEIASEEVRMNGKSADIHSGSTLVLKQNNLEANTEYSIFFLTKPSNGASLSFKMSGFKDNTKFDYNNGANGDWGGDFSAKENIYNWIEHLSINKNEWLKFRYDFTTGFNEENSVQVLFEATGGNVHIDGIFLGKKSDLDEGVPELPGNDKISKGHKLLIENGLQFQSWITTDDQAALRTWMKVPSLEKILDMGLTAVQYNDSPNFNKRLHDEAKGKVNGENLKWSTAFGPKSSHISPVYQEPNHNVNKGSFAGAFVGSPTLEEWANGFLDEKSGLGYIEDLISMCIGDEEDYSDTLTQNLKSWFEVIRKHYPNVMVHHNEVGNSPQGAMAPISTFNKDMLSKYVRTAKPDMITYDMYYFRERRVGQTKGGSVIQFYDDLNRYRIVSSEGYDGTGEQPIPFGQYHYSWRTGPGAATPLKRGDGWYEMTQSQINLYSFATWAFGGKWMSNFRWLDETTGYLFSDYKTNPDGSINPYYLFDQYKEMIRQSKNLGPHLTRIQNKDVAIVRGEQKTSNGIVQNGKPDDNPDWASIKNDRLNKNVFIDDIKVANLGEQNNGLNGDVFISYFEPLVGLSEEDKQVFTSTDPRYFTLLNGLTAGDGLPVEMQQGSSYETRQEIKVTFDLPSADYASKLKKVSRVDGGDTLDEQGKVVDVPLEHIGSTKYEMTLIIGGGLADLFYFELGDKNTSTTTKAATEDSEDERIVGEKKYITEIEKRDLEGRTFIIGNIKGTDKAEPAPQLGKNPNTPAPADLVDGKVLNLTTGPTPGGNIGAIGMRYFRQDIWEFRLKRIQEDNNVKLKFKEYDWDKETLMANVRKVQNGEEVEGMPDVLIIPDEWSWEKDGLIENDLLLAAQDFEVFDFTERKWNHAYKEMTTKDDKTYGLFTDVSMNPTGVFANKKILGSMGLGYNIYELQREDKWTFTQLQDIIAKVPGGKKLFADNEHLVRQLLVSSGVDTEPSKFDANSAEFKMAMELYQKLKDKGLLFQGNLDDQMVAFQNGDLVFLVAPYTEVAPHLAAQYWYYEDNTIRKHFDDFRGWGPQTVTQPVDGKDWEITVRNKPAGKYAMGLDDWNFMLFPKPSVDSEYKSILNKVSYPVILASTQKADDTAFIWNQIAEEYKGIDSSEFLFRGQEGYPADRTWEGQGQIHRDLDTLRKVGLRDGYGDLLKASGTWDNVLAEAIKTNPNDYDGINSKVQAYWELEEPVIPEEPVAPEEPETPEEPVTPEEPEKPEKPVAPEKPVKPQKPVTPAKPEKVIILPKLTPGSPEKLKDILNHWAKKEIETIVSSGLMVGRTETSFAAQDNLNRAEMATILNRLVNKKAENISSNFKDIKGDEWYSKDIENVNALRLFNGYPDGKFNPKANITRAEVASLIARVLRFNNIYVEVNSADQTLVKYQDVTNIPAWAKTDLVRCIDQGIIGGDDKGNLNPTANITRAEIAVILTRVLALQK